MTFLRKDIDKMSRYIPGFQPPDADSWIKINTNENPYPPSPEVVAAIQQELGVAATVCANILMLRAPG